MHLSKISLQKIVCALAIIFANARSVGADEPLVAARGVMVMNMKSNSVLYLQDADRRVPPASLAKIMTMHLVLDGVDKGRYKLTDVVRVSKRAASTGGAKMGLMAGDRLTLEQLLRGVAAASGNDASVAVAEYAAGSVERFVSMMNARARELGMKNTRFANPHGLPPAKGQYTTARDMMTLSHSYITKHADALAKYHSLASVTHRSKTTTNKNPLLGTCDGVDGLKTGWIQASGHSLITTARRGDVRIIVSLLGAETNEDEEAESRFLIEAAFSTVASGGTNKVIHQLAERASAKERQEALKDL